MPVFARNTCVVHFAGDDQERLAVKNKLAAGDLKPVAQRNGIGACTEGQNDDSENYCELKRSAQTASFVRDCRTHPFPTKGEDGGTHIFFYFVGAPSSASTSKGLSENIWGWPPTTLTPGCS